MTDTLKVFRREGIESLRQLLSKYDEVVLAYLFGSIAEEGFSAHDIDLALKLKTKRHFWHHVHLN